MDLALILQQTQCDTMHRRISPSFVKESTCSIQVLKVVFIWFGPPKFHVRDFEIAPKVTGAVPVRFYIMFWPPLAIHNPLFGIILMQIFRMCGHELFCLWPQGRDGLRRIVQIDRKSIGLVMVTHPAENIVVNVAEKVYLWLHAPIVADILQGWVFVEHATIPAAHLMVRYHRTILDFLFFEHLGGLIEQVAVDPGGYCPMFFRNQFYKEEMWSVYEEAAIGCITGIIP